MPPDALSRYTFMCQPGSREELLNCATVYGSDQLFKTLLRGFAAYNLEDGRALETALAVQKVLGNGDLVHKIQVYLNLNVIQAAAQLCTRNRCIEKLTQRLEYYAAVNRVRDVVLCTTEWDPAPHRVHLSCGRVLSLEDYLREACITRPQLESLYGTLTSEPLAEVKNGLLDCMFQVIRTLCDFPMLPYGLVVKDDRDYGAHALKGPSTTLNHCYERIRFQYIDGFKFAGAVGYLQAPARGGNSRRWSRMYALNVDQAITNWNGDTKSDMELRQRNIDELAARAHRSFRPLGSHRSFRYSGVRWHKHWFFNDARYA